MVAVRDLDCWNHVAVNWPCYFQDSTVADKDSHLECSSTVRIFLVTIFHFLRLLSTQLNILLVVGVLILYLLLSTTSCAHEAWVSAGTRAPSGCKELWWVWLQTPVLIWQVNHQTGCHGDRKRETGEANLVNYSCWFRGIPSAETWQNQTGNNLQFQSKALISCASFFFLSKTLPKNMLKSYTISCCNYYNYSL